MKGTSRRRPLSTPPLRYPQNWLMADGRPHNRKDQIVILYTRSMEHIMYL